MTMQHKICTYTNGDMHVAQVDEMHSSAIQILHFSFCENIYVHTLHMYIYKNIWLMCCDLLHKNWKGASLRRGKCTQAVAYKNQI